MLCYVLLKTRRCADIYVGVNQQLAAIQVKHKISYKIVLISILYFIKYFRDSIIMLLCTAKEAYLEQTALNHY